jgi:hypothetical protein
VDPVPGADGHTVPVTHDGENLKVGSVKFDARRDGKSPTMDSMESVGFHVVGETARTSDAGHEDRVLGLELFLGEEALDGGEDRVVTTTGAPPGQGGFIVAHAEDAVVLLGEVEERTSAAHEAPPSGIF